MEASEVLDRLRPPSLLVDDGISPETRKYSDNLQKLAPRGNRDQIDNLAAGCEDLKLTDKHYSVLALRLANAYLQARDLNAAGEQVKDALKILGEQVGAACQQNTAVALLYLGLTLHFMGWRNNALQQYEKASSKFREAALGWQNSSSGLARAIQCELAADRLQDCVSEMLNSIAAQKSTSPSQSVWEPKNIPQTSPPQVPQSDAPSTLFPTVATIAFGALVCLLIVATGFIAYREGGRTGMIIYAVSLITTLAVTLLIWRSYRRGNLLLKVPENTVAVIEQSGTLYEVRAGQAKLLLPWISRLHALVPMKRITYKPPKHKVSLGKNPTGSSTYVSLAMQIDYVVFSPVDATSPAGGLSAANRNHRGVWTEEDLKANWQTRLLDKLTAALADYMWGATEADCCASRDQIQVNLKNALAQKTQSWGIEVEELTILDVSSG